MAHQFSAAAAGALNKREAERQAREFRKGGEGGACRPGGSGRLPGDRGIREAGGGVMTREQLALLLENEAFLSAAERVRCGEDPQRVLSDLRPFVPRYDDACSREAVATFQDVAAGREAIAGG